MSAVYVKRREDARLTYSRIIEGIKQDWKEASLGKVEL